MHYSQPPNSGFLVFVYLKNSKVIRCSWESESNWVKLTPSRFPSACNPSHSALVSAWLQCYFYLKWLPPFKRSYNNSDRFILSSKVCGKTSLFSLAQTTLSVYVQMFLFKYFFVKKVFDRKQTSSVLKGVEEKSLVFSLWAHCSENDNSSLRGFS